MNPPVSLAGPRDRTAVVDTVVAAFRHDPAFRFFFPDPESYEAEATVFSRYLFDARVGHDTVWMIDRAAAVAMWAPPSPEPAAPSDGVAARLVAAGTDRAAAERVERYEAIVEGAIPDAPHWYLGILATHPHHAGQRLGRQVMTAGLERAAGEGIPAYLETTSPTNVELYRRSGWRVETEVAVDDLEVWVLSHTEGI